MGVAGSRSAPPWSAEAGHWVHLPTPLDTVTPPNLSCGRRGWAAGGGEVTPAPPTPFFLAGGESHLAPPQRRGEARPSERSRPVPLVRKGPRGRPGSQSAPARLPTRGLAASRLRSMAVKKIAIFGATGKTGLTTLAQAVQAGMNWDGREVSRGA